MICIWRGIYLYATTFSMSLCFLILPSFSLTRYLRIDKNYTLSIFMLSGSIRFHSQIQFNIRHAFILNHTFYFIHDQCKTILMLIHFHMLSLYKSLIISRYAFSHTFTLQITDHIKMCIFTCKPTYLTQIMRFKHILPRMYLVYKSHLHSSKFVISLCLYNSHS